MQRETTKFIRDRTENKSESWKQKQKRLLPCCPAWTIPRRMPRLKEGEGRGNIVFVAYQDITIAGSTRCSVSLYMDA